MRHHLRVAWLRWVCRGLPKKQAFLDANPHRFWDYVPEERLEEWRTARRFAAEKGLEPPPGQPRNFQYPFPTQVRIPLYWEMITSR